MPLETGVFDANEFIETSQEQAEYLRAALEDGDVDAIAIVLGDIARARGASQFAKDTGLSPNNLQGVPARRKSAPRYVGESGQGARLPAHHRADQGRRVI